MKCQVCGRELKRSGEYVIVSEGLGVAPIHSDCYAKQYSHRWWPGSIPLSAPINSQYLGVLQLVILIVSLGAIYLSGLLIIALLAVIAIGTLEVYKNDCRKIEEEFR